MINKKNVLFSCGASLHLNTYENVLSINEVIVPMKVAGFTYMNYDNVDA